MIEVVKVIGSTNTDRPSKIYSAIFGRAAQYYPKEERLKHVNAVFTEKRIDFDKEWCKPYNITSVPTTLFFKDNELVERVEGIMATIHIFEILEKI